MSKFLSNIFINISKNYYKVKQFYFIFNIFSHLILKILKILSKLDIYKKTEFCIYFKSAWYYLYIDLNYKKNIFINNYFKANPIPKFI
jgi:hypothetical protein